MHRLVIGIIVILVNIAFVPCINANFDINKDIQSNDNENLNCFIFGKTSWTTFYKTDWDGLKIYILNLLPILIITNGTIGFGEDQWNWNGGSGDGYTEPASGWICTIGSNGIKTWRGDELWGNLGSDYFEYSSGEYNYEHTYFRGAIGFTGIRVRSLLSNKCRYFGIASVANIVTEFPD